MPKRLTAPETIRRAFTTRAPSGARQAALRGIRALDAERRARLAQAAKDEARAAALQKRVTAAQLGLPRQARVDARALRRLVTAHRQQGRRISRRLGARTMGARVPAPQAVAGSQYTLLTPPYTWEWSDTWVIDYAPGELTATADRESGEMTFVDNPADSEQVDRSGGASAVGFSFQPLVDGVLTVSIPAEVKYWWYYICSYAGANTRGWAGLIVQSFPVRPQRAGRFGQMLTHVLQRHVFFDKGGQGGYPSSAQEGGDITYNFQATFAVNHTRWYTIWLWCGGDIHAEGFNEWTTGSFAESELDILMPYVILNFQTP